MHFKKILSVLFSNIYFLLIVIISLIKILSGTAEIPQPIKSLPHKHTYLISFPGSQVKESNMVIHSGNPSEGEVEMGGFSRAG